MATSGHIPEISTRILTLMVRGIFSSLRLPLANFPTAGVTGVELHDTLWEAVEKLERCDFMVVSLSFGKVRQSGGWSSNPSSKTVQEATDVIRLQTSSVLDEVRSSFKAKRWIFANAPPQVDDTPLPKWKRNTNK